MKVRIIEKTEEEYEQMLDDIYGEVEICGMTFSSGRALRELDPTAFRCGLCDEPTMYECGECGAQFEDEDEAEKCCEEVDDPDGENEEDTREQ